MKDLIAGLLVLGTAFLILCLFSALATSSDAGVDPCADVDIVQGWLSVTVSAETFLAQPADVMDSVDQEGMEADRFVVQIDLPQEKWWAPPESCVVVVGRFED